VPFAFAAAPLTPKTKGDRKDECQTQKDRLKRLDIIGCLAMLFAIILLILGLTLGASYGWKTAKFLVPFLFSWPIFIGFFFWEAKLPEGYALIPPSTWKIPNLTLLIVFALGIYPWWAVSPESPSEMSVRRLIVFPGQSTTACRAVPRRLWRITHHRCGSNAAPGSRSARHRHGHPVSRQTPMESSGSAADLSRRNILQKLGSARWPIALGMLLGAVSYLLMIFVPNGEIHNNEYWRWYFPAFIIGSGAAMMSFLGTK
jgi:hypothetical protein